MLINKNVILAAGVGLVLGASSCRKYLNVNENPNISPTATVQTLLPAAQLYVASAVGVDLQINGSIWAQFWTQAPIASQYVALEQFATGQDAFSTPWSNLYTGAENFYQLYNLADSQKKRQYKAISLLMQAYTFQLITDGWGDAPFKQALKGQYENGHLVNPKYDSQRVIYNGIIAYIDTATKWLSSSDAVRPGSDDLIYGGDMSKWKKFANTLKLRVLVRLSSVDPGGAQAKITALYNTAPSFIGPGDDAKIDYGFNSANKNPLYGEATALGFVQNLGGSKTCIDSMNNNLDPRVNIFYTAGAGITQGTYNTALPAGSYALPSAYVGGNVSDANSSNAPVNLLSSWESLFLQAEVSARGWANAGSDSALFFDAIQANFDYYSAALNNEYLPITTSAYADYLGGGGYWIDYPWNSTDVNEKLRFIITQKWFASCGNQGFEAWTEWRRTGYPDFLVHPVSSQIGNQFPMRFLYPTSESSVNVNFPASGVVPLTVKVWWDRF
jgi:hypothetical protein